MCLWEGVVTFCLHTFSPISHPLPLTDQSQKVSRVDYMIGLCVWVAGIDVDDVDNE